MSADTKQLTTTKPVEVTPKRGTAKRRKMDLRNFASKLFRHFGFYQSIEENEHVTDTASADAHNSQSVREELKSISRRETANNGYLKGISRTYANDIVGTGPRVQVTDERFQQQDRVRIGKAFNRWLNDIRFADKLTLLLKAGEHDDGEGFGYVHPVDMSNVDERNDCYYRNPIGLDFRAVECDRFKDDDGSLLGVTVGNLDENGNMVDGIEYDAHGNPLRYRMLRRHPGDTAFFAQSSQEDNEKYLDIPANFVIHLYTQERVEQRRGVPRNQASLTLAQRLRTYRDAIVGAMCKAAAIGGYLQTGLEPIADVVYDENGEPVIDDFGDIETEVDCPDAGETFEADPDVVQCLPRGYEYKQHDTPDVVNSHKEFIELGVSEMGRENCMPRHKATGDSSNYNFASVRNDGLDWRTCVKIRRSRLDWHISRLFCIWWNFAQFNPQVLPEDLRDVIIDENDLPQWPEHKFHWDGLPHVDPEKQAKSQLLRLQIGEINMYDLAAENGENWDEKVLVSARALGLTPEQYQAKICNFLWSPQAGQVTQEFQSEETGGEEED